jgi:transcriptional regulator with XRE-family HTH domain
MKISDNIKSARMEKGFTIEELSSLAGVSIDIIEKIEIDEDFALKDPYGRLYAKKLCQFLQLDCNIPSETVEINLIKEKNHNLSQKVSKFLPHLFAGFILIAFIYANANLNKNTTFQVNPVQHKEETKQVKIISENQDIQITYIVLKADDEVWITATIDGEKTIFNIKKGEEKTLYFENKIVFDTVGNADKLEIIYGDQEVRISDREIIHNVFVDSEGIFYNGYNVLIGAPKI